MARFAATDTSCAYTNVARSAVATISVAHTITSEDALHVTKLQGKAASPLANDAVSGLHTETPTQRSCGLRVHCATASLD
jgi:hypothetical protein